MKISEGSLQFISCLPRLLLLFTSRWRNKLHSLSCFLCFFLMAISGLKIFRRYRFLFKENLYRFSLASHCIFLSLFLSLCLPIESRSSRCYLLTHLPYFYVSLNYCNIESIKKKTLVYMIDLIIFLSFIVPQSFYFTKNFFCKYHSQF